jgi:hypothetical protein
MRISTLCLLPVAVLLGCSSPGSTSTGDSDLTGHANAAASHCELFVDRAGPHFDSHGLEALTLYLKTPLGKLDARGGIKEVGFHAEAIADGKTGAFKDIVATSFVGSADYWQIRFEVQSDFTPQTTWIGAFYVEAKDGSRLWVNSTNEGGPNFVIDSNMVQNLANLRGSGFFASSTTDGPPTAIVAADEFPYLNPSGCR